MDLGLQQLLRSAGLGELAGGSRASRIIGALLSKNKKTGYERPGARPFDANKINNPSPFIQSKYLDGDIKPFNYCEAQRRREQEEDEEEREESGEEEEEEGREVQEEEDGEGG